MTMATKRALKTFLGEIPITAEIYWLLRQDGRPVSKNFSLERLKRALPEWNKQIKTAQVKQQTPRRVLLFVTLRYWIEHAALLSASLAGAGHDVTLAYLPYANWMKATTRFDLRRHNTYSRKVLEHAGNIFRTVSFLDEANDVPLPVELGNTIREVSIRDTQYTLQVEDVDQDSALFRLREERNRHAASAFLNWLHKQDTRNRPDIVLTPNGSILEMGAIYQTARYLELPVVTYEFGEQRDRIWLAKDAVVMQQDTGRLWSARKNVPLTSSELDQIRDLMASRQRADLWENFSRRWQGLPSQGADQTRASLGISQPEADPRPIVLLAANVIGDSLTLGRQVFTENMSAWLRETVRYFTGRPNTQLVVRIHPGERYTKGPSVAELLRSAFPHLPSHIHLVEAGDPVNTYDLINIADFGLAYTTTVGLEMAMSGLPVIVAGQTHYRERGFTFDPGSWQEYIDVLEQILSTPDEYRLSQQQVEQAWNYAYRFFFEYPCPFPWHLLYFWDELNSWPLSRVLSKEGQLNYKPALEYLAGADRHWDAALPTI